MTDIATRASWGARYDDGDLTLTGLALEVFAHHSVTAQLSPDASVEDERAQMRSIEQTGHTRFATPQAPNFGISYNVLIFPSGRAYQGVSWNRRGAHTDGRNSTVRSICFVGNYEEHEPTPAQLATASAIYAEGKGKWWVAAAPVRGHRDLKPTACPGRHVYAQLPAIYAGVTPTSTGGFMSDLTTDQQKDLLEKVGQTATRTEQLITKIDRLEADEAARRSAALKHERASAARERVLVEGMKTLAGSVGLDPATVERLLAEALKDITLKIVKEN